MEQQYKRFRSVVRHRRQAPRPKRLLPESASSTPSLHIRTRSINAHDSAIAAPATSMPYSAYRPPLANPTCNFWAISQAKKPGTHGEIGAHFLRNRPEVAGAWQRAKVAAAINANAGATRNRAGYTRPGEHTPTPLLLLDFNPVRDANRTTKLRNLLGTIAQRNESCLANRFRNRNLIRR